MSRTTKASDWQASGGIDAQAGFGIAGGVSLFVFSSSEARFKGIFAFAGVGFGGGLNLSAVMKLGSAKLLKAYEILGDPAGIAFPGEAPARLSCDRPFSVSDLDCSFGFLASGGLAAIVGYQWTCITARGWNSSYFTNQPCFGKQINIGASVINAVGAWRLLYQVY